MGNTERLKRKLDAKRSFYDCVIDSFKKSKFNGTVDDLVVSKPSTKKAYCKKCFYVDKDDYMSMCKNKNNTVLVETSNWAQHSVKTTYDRSPQEINALNDCAWYMWNFVPFLKYAGAVLFTAGMVVGLYYFSTYVSKG